MTRPLYRTKQVSVPRLVVRRVLQIRERLLELFWCSLLHRKTKKKCSASVLSSFILPTSWTHFLFRRPYRLSLLALSLRWTTVIRWLELVPSATSPNRSPTGETPS